MFETIINDSYLLNIYKQIKDIETNTSKNPLEKNLANHSLDHINNVIHNVEIILKQLNYDDKLIEASKIAAFLHDLGVIKGKKNHNIRSYEITKNYFEENNLYPDFYNEILEAIKDHSNGFNSNNIITNVLILADKLDIKKDRLGLDGYEVIGLRQIEFIEDIKINISLENNLLEIKFIVDDKCDKIELNNYYFINKVFIAINSFSNYFQLENKVWYNNTLWNFNIKRS